MAFSDEDIRALVKSGGYTNAGDEKYVADTLIERRNLIGKHWFLKANPLDEFDVQASALRFKDLAVQYGFVSEGQSSYHVDVIARPGGRKGEKITSFETKEPLVALESGWGNDVNLLIRTVRPGASKPGPYVLVEIGSKGVAGVSHQD
jgi:hypothetical protein